MKAIWQNLGMVSLPNHDSSKGHSEAGIIYPDLSRISDHLNVLGLAGNDLRKGGHSETLGQASSDLS